MTSLDSVHFEHNSPPSSPPPMDEEKMSVQVLACEALDLLASQDCKVSFVSNYQDWAETKRRKNEKGFQCTYCKYVKEGC